MTAQPAPLSADQTFVALQAALAGEYSLERELGRGGMGIVYLAREVRLAREVALKVLPPALATSTEMRARFLREAQTAARLSHPNIVPIFRVDEAGGFVYFAMAYVPGVTLAEQIRAHGPLAPHRARRLVTEVAWALSYAHANGVIHRDVKAENILIEHGTGRALVTDFGIANAATVDSRADDGRVMGSAHYLSPEQAAGEPTDERSDLYSLGVVGYLALTGRLPFDAPTTRELLVMQLRSTPTPITTIASHVPPNLAEAVGRSLAKHPARRHQSAADLAAAVDAAIEPVREPPAPVRVWVTKRTAPGGAAKAVVLGYGATMIAVILGRLTDHSGLGLAAGAAFWVSWLGPLVRQTRRVLRAGYGLDDLRAGLREHWRRRREELAFEFGASGGVAWPTVTLLGLGTSAVIGFAVYRGIQVHAPLGGLAEVVVATLGTGAVLGALAIGLLRWGRQIQLSPSGTLGVRFWNSKWGERVVRLASIGLRRGARQSVLPQLTEIALGRATDALFDALPREHKRRLKDLPATVRRLEGDATRMRKEIAELDASIAALQGDEQIASSPRIAAALDADSALRGDRATLDTELHHLRERANEQLATSVAALENIRIDLLRLQLGEGRIESVTAALDAAREASHDIRFLVDAQQEVDLSLRT